MVFGDLLDGIWGLLKGSRGVLDHGYSGGSCTMKPKGSALPCRSRWTCTALHEDSGALMRSPLS